MFVLIEKLNLLIRFTAIGVIFLLVVTFFLLVMHKWLKKSGYIRLLYAFMLFSAAGAFCIFFTGIVYACLPINILVNQWTFSVSGWKTASGNADSPFILAVVGIWTPGMLRGCREICREQKQLDLLCRMNRPVTDIKIQNCFCHAAERAGVTTIPMLFCNPAVKVPFLKGIRHAAVVLPEGILSDQEQALIFAHELTHYRRHDLLFRYFLKTVFVIYWFLPFDSVWMEMFVELQETLCDIDVCRRYGSSLSARVYYTAILSISGRMWSSSENRTSWQISGLSDHTSQLERRIGNMSGYRNGTRRIGIETAVIAAGSLLFLGNVLLGMYWPDILVKQDKITGKIEICEETAELMLADMEATVLGLVKEQEKSYPVKELQWDRLTSYTLEPGQQISSKIFRGNEEKNLILMAAASSPGYEVCLMSGEKVVYASRMEDIISLNFTMENADYRLLIKNTAGVKLNLELYCSR